MYMEVIPFPSSMCISPSPKAPSAMHPSPNAFKMWEYSPPHHHPHPKEMVQGNISFISNQVEQYWTYQKLENKKVQPK